MFTILILLSLSIYLYLSMPLFGRTSRGIRKKTIENSKNFKEGQFHNLEDTPALSEGQSYPKIIFELLFAKTKNAKPLTEFQANSVSLMHLDRNTDLIVWFGHSSYLLQVNQMRYLVDPVLTKNAAPVYGFNNAFKGTDFIRPEDLPQIDYLLITHDHYDHLDYSTIKGIIHKTDKVICPLGVGETLEFWGIKKEVILEKDWGDKIDLDHETSIELCTARHFSGRLFKRNTSLWTSYVLKTRSYKIFIGGDSGYGKHFAEIGQQHGPFDLAILENGQYDHKWKYIHMLPEECIQAASDLRSNYLLPVHSAKFKLANHPWKEPLERISKEALNYPNIQLVTPQLGQIVLLSEMDNFQRPWWKDVE